MPGAPGERQRPAFMTAIVGLFQPDRADAEPHARRALEAMHARGREHVAVWADGGVALGAVCEAWELAAGGPPLAADDSAVVVTDATLYYLADLRAALRHAGMPHEGPPAALILAAYSAWGTDALHRLEGDFALILWDRRQQRVLAARDPGGFRPLFHTSLHGGLALASRLDGLACLPRFDAALDSLSLADDALFLRVHTPTRTAYRNATRLPAGHRLLWQRGASPDVTRWWEVPLFTRGDGPPFAEAVEELRRLILHAVAERSAGPHDCGIWLSGGYDSPTLFAASQVAARTQGTHSARPVSISYPQGDPGYEDDLIRLTTEHWRTEPAWVHADEVPELTDPVSDALLRDEPFFHPYEPSNRALARATRAIGCRVALVGNGGDQFFSVGVARLADHFRRGHFLTLARDWREAGGGKDWRLFAREVVSPNLPDAVARVAAWLRGGRRPQHRLTRRIAAWADTGFDQFAELRALNATPLQRRPGEGHAAVEQSWFLRHVTGERINASYTATGLLDGVDVRTPLFDTRIIRFAAARPLWEGYSRRENKRLLRASFAAELPPGVSGPRRTRTGLPYSLLFRTARELAAWVLKDPVQGMILADLHVIDGTTFSSRARVWADKGAGDADEAATLVASVQVECWLRARLGWAER